MHRKGEQTMSKVEEALSLFEEGFSCSQAVFAVYATDYGMDKEMALKVAQGFGAGMGGMRGECGCVTGAYMVISLIHGRTKAEDGAARAKTFTLVKEFNKRFKEIHKVSTCRELLEGKKGSHFEMCSDYVSSACEILNEILELED